jgi:hypothetical protein
MNAQHRLCLNLRGCLDKGKGLVGLVHMQAIAYLTLLRLALTFMPSILVLLHLLMENKVGEEERPDSSNDDICR